MVILGLIGIKLSEISPNLTFLSHADALSALGVAIIVIVVSV